MQNPVATYVSDRPKNAPEGTAPRRSFDQYTILSRAVLSQSTQPAKPIGFLGAGQPNPVAKSMSWYPSSWSFVCGSQPRLGIYQNINQFGIVGRHP